MFQALSIYGYTKAVDRERLISDLLFRVLSVQVGTLEHDLLLDTTLQRLQRHRCPDTDPSEVEDIYRRILDRLGEFAQSEKLKALALLQPKILSINFNSSQYDFPQRILAFLYHSSRGVIASEYIQGAIVDKLVLEAQNAGLSMPTYLSDSTITGSWKDSQHFSDSCTDLSSLSEWQEFESNDDANCKADEASNMLVPEATLEDSSASKVQERAAFELDMLQACQNPNSKGQVQLQPYSRNIYPTSPTISERQTRVNKAAAPPVRSQYHPGSLPVWLAAKQSDGQPARELVPELRFTEHSVVQQVLHMLNGVTSPGPAFHMDPVRGIFTVTPGSHLISISKGSTHTLLQFFADLGTSLWRIREFCTTVMVPANLQQTTLMRKNEWTAENPDMHTEAELQSRTYQLQRLPTVAAFAAALNSQLKVFQRQLIAFEVSSCTEATTLLQLKYQVEGLRYKARALQAAVLKCDPKRSAAETAAGLLSNLHNAVQEQMLLSASQGGTLAAMLFQVFTATCKPYLDRLQAFMHDGDLSQDIEGELFVAADPAIQPTSPLFWTAAYTLRRTSNDTVAAPCFLLPIVNSLLASGKSAVLMKASLAQAAVSQCPSSSLSKSTGFSRLVKKDRVQRPSQQLSWCSAASSSSGTPRGIGIAQMARQLSPTKQRMTAINALGYNAATGTPRYTALQQHVPEETFSGLLLAAGSEPDAEHDLHACFLSSLQTLMRLHTSAGGHDNLKACESMSVCCSMNDTVADVAGHFAVSRGQAGGMEVEEDTESCHEDWLCDSTAACMSHSLFSPLDDLPPLPPIVRSIRQLNAPQAVIPETTARAVAMPVGKALPGQDQSKMAVVAVECPGSKQTSSTVAQHDKDSLYSQHQQQRNKAECLEESQQGVLSIADRMRQAALQRVRQSCSKGHSFLHQQPVAQLHLAERVQVASLERRTPSPGFDTGSWASWYEHISAAFAPKGVCAKATLPHCSPELLLLPNRLKVGWEDFPDITPAMCTHALPLDSLLQHSLIGPLQSQAQQVSAQLTAHLLHRWGLRRQLLTLREVFLMGSPLIAPFMRSLFLRISSRQGLDGLSEFELNSALEQCFLSSGREDLLTVTAEILPHPSGPQAAARRGTTGAQHEGGSSEPGSGGADGQLPPGMPTVGTLSRLRLGMDCGWPLCLVASPEILQQYNSMLVLLMQMHWVKQSLDSLQRSQWKKHTGSTWDGTPACPAAMASGERKTRHEGVTASSSGSRGESGSDGKAAVGPVGGVAEACTAETGHGAPKQSRLALRLSQRDRVVQQMSHLTTALLQYMGDRSLAAWHWLQQSLMGCQSLDELQRCHAKYLKAVLRSCLLGSDTLSRLVLDAVLRLLDCALQYCWLSSQLAKLTAAVAAEEAMHGPLAALSGVAAAARQREAKLKQLLAKLRQDYSSRQRLLAKVLVTKAGEVGAHAGELRHLLAAIDFNGFFQLTI